MSIYTYTHKYLLGKIQIQTHIDNALKKNIAIRKSRNIQIHTHIEIQAHTNIQMQKSKNLTDLNKKKNNRNASKVKFIVNE